MPAATKLDLTVADLLDIPRGRKTAVRVALEALVQACINSRQLHKELNWAAVSLYDAADIAENIDRGPI